MPPISSTNGSFVSRSSASSIWLRCRLAAGKSGDDRAEVVPHERARVREPVGVTITSRNRRGRPWSKLTAGRDPRLTSEGRPSATTVRGKGAWPRIVVIGPLVSNVDGRWVLDVGTRESR